MGRKQRKAPAAPKDGEVPAREAWPACSPEMREVASLIPYARNARTHSKAQVAKIAASIREWGFTNPVLVDERNGIIAGHGRVLAAQSLKLAEVPVIVARGWTDAQRRAYVIADNKLALDAGWDPELLGLELQELGALDFDLSLTGFGESEIQGLLFRIEDNPLEGADDVAAPDLEKVTVSRPGDVWLCGPHRVMVGDSTDAGDVAKLMTGETATCILADPPYGMGKERDGVANDNLYRERLDAFQMSWWRVYREHLAGNGSLYLWGNAPDLWRLWYVGGLAADGELTMRNEIVWAKGSAFGMRSGDAHGYPPESERCLFLMRGQQFLGNQNLDAYWEGWEPLRAWLVGERDKAGWKNSDVNRLTESHMAGHWFGKSQFAPISSDNYAILQRAAEGRAFVEPYDQLFVRLFPGAREGGNEYRRELSEQLRGTRTFFDNTHDVMTDVWRFNRVAGEERFGHATPKPVAVMGRMLRSSVPEGELAVEPFCGTGPGLIAGHLLGRRVFAMELEPAYVDVTVRRWQGKATAAARLEGDGRTFDEIARERAPALEEATA